jgi:hypothetical protein
MNLNLPSTTTIPWTSARWVQLFEILRSNNTCITIAASINTWLHTKHIGTLGPTVKTFTFNTNVLVFDITTSCFLFFDNLYMTHTGPRYTYWGGIYKSGQNNLVKIIVMIKLSWVTGNPALKKLTLTFTYRHRTPCFSIFVWLLCRQLSSDKFDYGPNVWLLTMN